MSMPATPPPALTPHAMFALAASKLTGLTLGKDLWIGTPNDGRKYLMVSVPALSPRVRETLTRNGFTPHPPYSHQWAFPNGL